jgi:hypothetical protein
MTRPQDTSIRTRMNALHRFRSLALRAALLFAAWLAMPSTGFA